MGRRRAALILAAMAAIAAALLAMPRLGVGLRALAAGLAVAAAVVVILATGLTKPGWQQARNGAGEDDSGGVK